jgi:hypothetical protein
MSSFYSAINLMRRVCHLTTIDTLRENLPLIRSILQKNDYPEGIGIFDIFGKFCMETRHIRVDPNYTYF